jgi:hypothetical protein
MNGGQAGNSRADGLLNTWRHPLLGTHDVLRRPHNAVKVPLLPDPPVDAGRQKLAVDRRNYPQLFETFHLPGCMRLTSPVVNLPRHELTSLL